MNRKEIEIAIGERVIKREPDMYIGSGKRRRKIWIEYIGIEENGSVTFGLDNSIEKRRKRTNNFAAGFGLTLSK